ncbi:helix-turn-helix transcriptional regulator [Streptomyces prasinus]|uniref:helix-turn-helix transcriptional regulator n=1 Tax=Streptomyces prasinus TaxID=67345 RepID=UPI003687FFA3
MNFYELPHRTAMTAEELARAAGTTKAQVLAYENGHRVPDPPRIRALALALKIHPWFLMNPDRRAQWTVADLRRACGLRAEDVVRELGVSPKVYRRFETEGIVPSRRPQFLDEVARTCGIQRKLLERAIGRTPAVQDRKQRVAELVKRMVERYVMVAGAWQGPDADDPDLIELAMAYGRPLSRTRRVITYELGELRHRYVRSLRERVVAEYDPDRERQAKAQHAADRWNDIIAREMARIPTRLESFHRNAQPSDVWQLLVDLYNAEAAPHGEAVWAVKKFLTEDNTALSPYLVEQRRLEDVTVCRLTREGLEHVSRFAGLYANLYRATRKPSRAAHSASRKVPPGTFTLPNHQARLVIPQPFLDRLQVPGTPRIVKLNARYFLTINLNSLAVSVLAPPPGEADVPKQASLFEWVDDEEILDSE